MTLITLRKSQSTLEYAALFAVVVGAIIAGQVYMKRGLQGKYKSSADQLGEQYSFESTTGTVVTTIDSSSNETVSGGVTTADTTQTHNTVTDLSISELDAETW